MKKFRFTLHSVQTIRGLHEMRAREAFSAAVKVHMLASSALMEARECIRNLELTLMEERRHLFRPAEQLAYINEQRQLKEAEAEAVKSLSQASEHMDKCRDLWIVARRDVRVIEKLETKARVIHRQDCDREEQAAMDDRVNARIGRAPLILT